MIDHRNVVSRTKLRWRWRRLKFPVYRCCSFLDSDEFTISIVIHLLAVATTSPSHRTSFSVAPLTFLVAAASVGEYLCLGSTCSWPSLSTMGFSRNTATIGATRVPVVAVTTNGSCSWSSKYSFGNCYQYEMRMRLYMVFFLCKGSPTA